MVNVYDKLALILALREISKLSQFEDERVFSTFMSAIYEDLYVDLELGSESTYWADASKRLGLKSSGMDIAKNLGKEVNSLCKKYNHNGWTDDICKELKRGEIPVYADRLWKLMICCELNSEIEMG